MDKTELINVELMEVSLVDFGDDPLAKVTMFKRQQEKDMDKEELTKALADLETVTKAKEVSDALAVELTTKVEDLTKALDDAKEATEKAKEAEDTVEIGGEKIAKSAIPATVLKHLEDMEKAAHKTAIEKKVAETIPHLIGKAEVKSRLIKSVMGDAEIMAMLSALDASYDKFLSTEIGKKGSDEDLLDPAAKLNTLAKAKQKESNMTFEAAYAEVSKTEMGKALLKEIYKDK